MNQQSTVYLEGAAASAYWPTARSLHPCLCSIEPVSFNPLALPMRGETKASVKLEITDLTSQKNFHYAGFLWLWELQPVVESNTQPACVEWNLAWAQFSSLLRSCLYSSVWDISPLVDMSLNQFVPTMGELPSFHQGNLLCLLIWTHFTMEANWKPINHVTSSLNLVMREVLSEGSVKFTDYGMPGLSLNTVTSAKSSVIFAFTNPFNSRPFSYYHVLFPQERPDKQQTCSTLPTECLHQLLQNNAKTLKDHNHKNDSQ